MERGGAEMRVGARGGVGGRLWRRRRSVPKRAQEAQWRAHLLQLPLLTLTEMKLMGRWPTTRAATNTRKGTPTMGLARLMTQLAMAMGGVG